MTSVIGLQEVLAPFCTEAKSALRTYDNLVSVIEHLTQSHDVDGKKKRIITKW